MTQTRATVLTGTRATFAEMFRVLVYTAGT